MANSFTSIEGSPRCCDLVTLFLSHNRALKTIPTGFFRFTVGLTVVDLSHSKLEVFPLEITNLQSLEFLNVSYSKLKKLPPEMKNLMRLKYLNFEQTSIKKIPVEVISNLSELQVLNMFRLRSYFYEKVKNNVLSKDGNKLTKELMCLKNLSELSLDVTSCSFLHSICSNQQLLNSISYLRLCDFSDSIFTFNILSLANAKQLLLLRIEGVGWEERETHTHKPDSSLNNNLPIFCHLREVLVDSCATMRHMTWLVFAPNLTILTAWRNDKMEVVISAEKLSEYQTMGEHLNLFPKLQLLQLFHSSELETICPKALSFPCLTQITVVNCPNLKKLPLNSESAEGCNVVIEGELPWWNDLTWEDDEARAAFSPCFQKRKVK